MLSGTIAPPPVNFGDFEYFKYYKKVREVADRLDDHRAMRSLAHWQVRVLPIKVEEAAAVFATRDAFTDSLLERGYRPVILKC